MTTVKCPFCGHPTTIDIAKATDEHGEEFTCENCKEHFRYATR